MRFVLSSKDPDHLSQFFKAGVHLGHRRSRWNPKMAPFLIGSRNGLHIIDLDQTMVRLGQALRVFQKILKGKGNALLVGNCRENALFTGALGRKYNVPFVNSKWVGGTLTNWRMLHGVKSLEKSKGKNKKMSTYVSNLAGRKSSTMGTHPDIIVFLNVKGNEVAVNEATSLGIPTIGIVDTDTDPESITYPIPGNDDSIKAHYVYSHLLDLALSELNESSIDVKTFK